MSQSARTGFEKARAARDRAIDTYRKAFDLALAAADEDPEDWKFSFRDPSLPVLVVEDETGQEFAAGFSEHGGKVTVSERATWKPVKVEFVPVAKSDQAAAASERLRVDAALKGTQQIVPEHTMAQADTEIEALMVGMTPLQRKAVLSAEKAGELFTVGGGEDELTPKQKIARRKKAIHAAKTYGALVDPIR